MVASEARILEIHLSAGGRQIARLACPAGLIPRPGQWIAAWASSEEPEASLRTVLFPTATDEEEGFFALLPAGCHWEPGVRLELRGPLGQGFELLPSTHRLALAAMGDTALRLLALLPQALAQGADVALFAGCPLPPLPAAVEIHPLAELPEALSWADFLALDVPIAHLEALRSRLGLEHGDGLLVPAQALIETSMPCTALAECGACAVPARHLKLACKDGPVFHLHELDW